MTLLVTDLDNTLWDWVAIWHAGFKALTDQIIATSGLDRAVLEADCQAVFQAHGTSEYAFLIEELPCLQQLHPHQNLVELYSDAIEASRVARRSTRRLYPGVKDTLEELKRLGCPVVAYTESMGFYTVGRLKSLGLDGLLDAVYSPPDHATPKDLRRHYEPAHYELQSTVHRCTPEGEIKPNADILLSIIRDASPDATPSATVYVGDSLMKDVKMAQDAGVIDAYAKYGLAHDTEAYQLLRRVTHWTPADVEREKQLLAGRDVIPSHVLELGFADLLDCFAFSGDLDAASMFGVGQ